MNFAPIDIVFIVLILIFAIRCSLRGFVGELMSMASVVLGLLAAVLFHSNGGDFVRERFMPEAGVFPEIIAFAAIFLAVFLAIKFLELLLKDIIERIRLGGADRFLGLFFGIAQGIVVVGGILFVLSIQPLFDAQGLLSGSFFAQLILPRISEIEEGLRSV